MSVTTITTRSKSYKLSYSGPEIALALELATRKPTSYRASDCAPALKNAARKRLAKGLEHMRSKRLRHEARPAGKLSKFCRPNELVTFKIIGENKEETEFIAHKETACRCDVFKRAFNSKFIEGQRQIYRLEDATPGTFEILVQWMYSNKLQLVYDEPDSASREERERALGEWNEETRKYDEESERIKSEEMSLVELWILAGRLCLPEVRTLANESLDKIVALHGFPAELLRIIYEITEPGSELREKAIGWLQLKSKVSLDFFIKYGHLVPQHLLLDWAIKGMEESLEGMIDTEPIIR